MLLYYSVEAPVEPDYVCWGRAGGRSSHPACVPVSQQGPQSPLKRAPVESQANDVKEPAARKSEGGEIVRYSRRSGPLYSVGRAKRMCRAAFVQPVRIRIAISFMFGQPLSAIQNTLQPCARARMRSQVPMRGIAEDTFDVPRTFKEGHQVPPIVRVVRVVHHVYWVSLIVGHSNFAWDSFT